MKYWLFQNNQVVGPYDREELANTPGFSAESLVCPEGRKGTHMGDWQRAGVVAELAETLLRMARVPAGAPGGDPGESMLPPEPTLRDLAVLGTLQEKVSLLENSLTQLQDDLQTRDEEISSLKSDLDQKAQETSALQGKVGDLEAKMSVAEALKEEVAKTQAEQSHEAQSIEDLKGQLDAARADIQESLTKVEESQTALRDELKGQVGGGKQEPVFAAEPKAGPPAPEAPSLDAPPPVAEPAPGDATAPDLPGEMPPPAEAPAGEPAPGGPAPLEAPPPVDMPGGELPSLEAPPPGEMPPPVEAPAGEAPALEAMPPVTDEPPSMEAPPPGEMPPPVDAPAGEAPALEAMPPVTDEPPSMEASPPGEMPPSMEPLPGEAPAPEAMSPEAMSPAGEMPPPVAEAPGGEPPALLPEGAAPPGEPPALEAPAPIPGAEAPTPMPGAEAPAPVTLEPPSADGAAVEPPPAFDSLSTPMPKQSGEGADGGAVDLAAGPDAAIPPSPTPAASAPAEAEGDGLVDLTAGAAKPASKKGKKKIIFLILLVAIVGGAGAAYHLGMLKLDPLLAKVGLGGKKKPSAVPKAEAPAAEPAAPVDTQKGLPDRTDEARDFVRGYPVGRSDKTLSQVLEKGKAASGLLSPWNVDPQGGDRFEVSFYSKSSNTPDYRFEVLLDAKQLRGLTATSRDVLSGKLPTPGKKRRATRKRRPRPRSRRRSSRKRARGGDSGLLADPLGSALLESALGEPKPKRKRRPAAPKAEEEADSGETVLPPAHEFDEQPKPKPKPRARRSRRSRMRQPAPPPEEKTEEELTLDELLLPGIPRKD